MNNTKEPTPIVEKALRQAFWLGQTYWAQAEQGNQRLNRRAEETRAKFEQLVAETCALSPEQAAQQYTLQFWKKTLAQECKRRVKLLADEAEGNGNVDGGPGYWLTDTLAAINTAIDRLADVQEGSK